MEIEPSTVELPSQESKKRLSAPIFVLILLTIGVVMFVAGLEVGEQRGVRSVVPEGEGRIVGQGEIPTGLEKDVSFTLFWDVWDHIGGLYLTDIVVSCYQQDQSTLDFEEADFDHYSSGETIVLGAGETMYITVEGVDGSESGNFALKLL